MISKILKLQHWSLLILLIFSTNSFSQNLLVNHDAETGNADGWVDSDDVWGAAAVITPHEGSYFFWPSRGNLPFTQIYQDVDVSGYSTGSYFYLSGWLANWNQSPHDKATLAIAAFDNNGNQLFHAAREHRNPIWGYYEIVSQLPVGTQTLRVYLIATRYVGSDNDAYFDDLSLEITNDAPDVFVNITSDGNRKNLEIGSTLQLDATTSGGSDNSYTWSSSYDEIASVDTNGLVTAVSKGTFTIQAIGNNTQTIGYISLVSHPENYIIFNTPKGSEEWESNQDVALSWDVIGTVGTSTLYWSLNDGVDWESISEIIPSTGEFLWSIPVTDETLNNCVLKIAWSGDETISSSFSIIPESETDINDGMAVPEEFSLSQNYPNPFNPSTRIEFAIPTSGTVIIKVFNSLGKEVAKLVNEEMRAGNHSVNFNATNLSSGIYFYRILASDFSQTNKMLLLR